MEGLQCQAEEWLFYPRDNSEPLGFVEKEKGMAARLVEEGKWTELDMK